MNTRRAVASAPFRQERYMSSPEIERGLRAIEVASRVGAIDNPEHRSLVWWLQACSRRPGGIQAVVNEILLRWPERFATPAMVELGFGQGRIYNAGEVRCVREEIVEGPCFRLRGEMDEWGFLSASHDDYNLKPWRRAELRASRARELRKARAHPTRYPAADFHEACTDFARRKLPRFLSEELCLNPAEKIADYRPWFCPRFVETLAELHATEVAAAESEAPITKIGAKVSETLEYALSERGLVVIDGLARTGKTFAVKAWCKANPGRSRYVQVPSSNDDMSFFRALCDALGAGSGSTYKAHELRSRAEDVLQGGDLLLVLDEGHYLWPQRNMRKAVPHRINWMLTQLVNMGVPVAIVTTPQFTKSQETLVKHGGWSSEQFIGRILHYERLPTTLADCDLEAVARHWLPGGDEKAIRVLTAYARSSEKYLQGIESLTRRARFLAKKEDRATPTFQDVATALQEGVVPSDKALFAALSGAREEGAKMGRRKAHAPSIQAVCNDRADEAKPTISRALRPAETAPLTVPTRETGASLLPH